LVHAEDLAAKHLFFSRQTVCLEQHEDLSPLSNHGSGQADKRTTNTPFWKVGNKRHASASS